METVMTTCHPSSPIKIEWVDNRLRFHGWIALTLPEVIQLRDFLNQIEIPEANPLR